MTPKQKFEDNSRPTTTLPQNAAVTGTDGSVHLTWTAVRIREFCSLYQWSVSSTPTVRQNGSPWLAPHFCDRI